MTVEMICCAHTVRKYKGKEWKVQGFYVEFKSCFII